MIFINLNNGIKMAKKDKEKKLSTKKIKYQEFEKGKDDRIKEIMKNLRSDMRVDFRIVSYNDRVIRDYYRDMRRLNVDN